jgi:hypothetical protein
LKPLSTKSNTRQALFKEQQSASSVVIFKLKLEMILVLGFSKKHLEYKFFFPEAWQ